MKRIFWILLGAGLALFFQLKAENFSGAGATAKWEESNIHWGNITGAISTQGSLPISNGGTANRVFK